MRTLYPAITPYDVGTLKVDDRHTLYFEQCGNPDGKPVVMLHGGPGGGCSDKMRQFHDPSKYRIILFDQRGAVVPPRTRTWWTTPPGTWLPISRSCAST
jgi:proline iminopeptidase